MHTRVSLLLLLAVLAAVGAIQLSGPPTQEFEVVTDPVTGNETIYEYNTQTMICTETDFQQNNLQIGATYQDVRCTPPKVFFNVPLKGFSSHASRLFVHDVCVVENPARLNASLNVDHKLPENAVFSRRLLALQLDPTIALSSGLADIQAGRSPICSLTFGLLGCNNRPSKNEAQIAQVNALQDWADSMTTWSNDELEAFTTQERINLGFRAAFEDQQQYNELLRQQVNGVQAAVGILAQNVDERFSVVEEAFGTVYQEIVNGITANAGYTDSRTQALQDWAMFNFQALVNASQVDRDADTYNRRQLQKRIRDLGRIIRDMQSNIQRARLNVDVHNAKSIGVWGMFADARSQGYEPYVDPDAAGFPPATTIPNEALEVYIDKLLINYVNQSNKYVASTTVAHQIGVDLYTATANLPNGQYAPANYQTFIDSIGPPGCAANATAAGVPIATRCDFWIRVSHQTCQPNAGFHWSSITSRSDRAAFDLNAAKCRGVNPQADYWDGRIIDNVTEWHALLGQMCSVALTQDLVNPHRVRVVSQRAGWQDVRQVSDPQLCSIDVDLIFEQAIYRNTLPFAIYQDWTLAYNVMLLDSKQYSELVSGRLPNHITHSVLDYQSLEDGRFYTCHRSSFVAFSRDTLPVFKVQTTGRVDAVVTSTAYSEPPVCDYSGCVFGTPLAAEQVIAPVVTIPRSDLLPSSDNVIVGELFATQMTSVIDAETKLSSVTKFTLARANTMQYALNPIPSGYDFTTALEYPDTNTLREWFSQNGKSLGFDHTLAIVSPDQLERTVQDGVCVLPPGVDAEWLCQLLDGWYIHPDTDFRSGIMVLYPKQWSTLFKVRVARGPVLQRVARDCPELSFTSYEGSNRKKLRVYNSLPVQIKVILRTSSTGPCTSAGDRPLTMNPKQWYEELVPACGDFEVEVRRRISDTITLSCEGAISTTVDPAAASNVDQAEIGGFNTTVIADAVGEGNYNLGLVLIQWLAANLGTITGAQQANLTPAQRFVLVNGTLTDLINRIIIISGGVDVTSNSAQAAVARQFAENAARDAAIQAVQAQQAAHLAQVDTDNAAMRQRVARLEQANATNFERFATLTRANAALVLQLRNDEGHIDGCDDSIPIIGPIKCAFINLWNNVWRVLVYILIALALLAFLFYCGPPILGCCSTAFEKASAAAAVSAAKKKATALAEARVAEKAQSETELQPLKRRNSDSGLSRPAPVAEATVRPPRYNPQFTVPEISAENRERASRAIGAALDAPAGASATQRAKRVYDAL